uniref:Cilia- and flagella-associated protein 157 n=1 Tax=Caenorhabditis tropicalis TaxID=1561998 RepID=A0A1I7UBA8_9PELO
MNRPARLEELIEENENLRRQLEELREENEARRLERMQELENIEREGQLEMARFRAHFQNLNDHFQAENTRAHLRSLIDLIQYLDSGKEHLQTVLVHLQNRNQVLAEFYLSEFKDKMRSLEFELDRFQRQLLESRNHREDLHRTLMSYTKDLTSVLEDLPKSQNYFDIRRISPRALETHITILNNIRQRGMRISHEYSGSQRNLQLHLPN